MSSTAAIAHRFEDYCDTPPDEVLPPLDRADPGPDVEMTEDARYWRENGYLILPKFLPLDLVDAYRRMFIDSNRVPGGWGEPQPYTHVPEMLDLCCYPPLVRKIEELIPTPMAVNLALTGWKSTTRTWHQDDYLNPPWMNAWYMAVWMALDDMHPDCGIFEYVPGSHKWPLMRGEKIRAALTEEQRNSPAWPRYAEELVTPLFDEKIRAEGLKIHQFHAKKGDVLLWHGRLAHRGSLPKNSELLRPALIAHYSSIIRRTEMPLHRRHKGGCFYMIFQKK